MTLRAASVPSPTPSRSQAWLAHAAILLVALAAGRWLAVSGSGGSIPLGLLALVGLFWLVLMFMLGPRTLFLGWLLIAPLLQNSADASSAGYALRWALFLAPAIVLASMTILVWQPQRPRWFDPIPLAYAAYVFGALVLTSDLLQVDLVGSLKAYFSAVILGVIVYYFLVVGPGRTISEQAIAAVLMVSVTLQSLLAVVEWRTGWNLWHDVSWRRDIPRPISTLANPGLLGMFIGIGIVIGLAVLAWEGPRALRKLAAITVVTGAPALALTLTRGPILATLVAAGAVLVLSGRTRLIGLGAIALSCIALFVLLPTIRASELYQQRVTQEANIQARVLLQDWSLRLAAEKPLTGWGYDSFDRVKNEADFGTNGLPPRYVLDSTSHDTYLTVLVEYGGVGMTLLLLPWVVLVVAGIKKARIPTQYRWAVVAAVASIVVIALTGATVDFRFFALPQALPWVFLGLLRRLTSS